MNKKVRVRYAPSPTGYQHIGGIRTALFNYLFARANNGDFILRIEDTDRNRYFDGAIEDIFETFKWLGIDYDEGPEKEGPYAPYFQSKRTDLYKKYAEELIKNDWAYYCYCDAERLERVKKEQSEKKIASIGYDRYCRNISEEEKKKLKEKNPNPVIRLKVPLEGKTQFEDKLFGQIEVDNSTLQDFILLKSDGFPTYHLANIVDDHFMEISHVLRAQEWIPSTPNHILLYKAFGWNPPQFYHLPMVLGEDGRKLSKRHGATQVRDFKEKGYLPEAIINFIVLLGWALDDKQEIFSLDELKKSFDINKINKSSAVFNYSKLNWFNGFYIRKKSIDELLKLTLPFYKDKKIISQEPGEEELDYLRKIIPLIQERIEFINEAPDKSDFMFGDLPSYKTWGEIIPKKTDKDTVIKILSDSKEILKKLGIESTDDLQHKLYDLSKKYEVKAGAVFMPIRIAITGINKSPELFPVMEILGKERVLNRIEEAIKKLQNE